MCAVAQLYQLCISASICLIAKVATGVYLGFQLLLPHGTWRVVGVGVQGFLYGQVRLVDCLTQRPSADIQVNH